MTRKTALVDGDELVYRHAFSAEEPTRWDDDIWSLHADEVLAFQKVDDQLEEIREAVGAEKIIVCLSDGQNNFRKSLTGTYKANRTGTRKPLLYGPIRQHLKTAHKGIIRPGLEADDVMGILATSESKSRRIIVSQDKDMRTVPCYYWNGRERRKVDGRPMIRRVSETQADFFHMVQTLAGDTTDGYHGCPGIGLDRAKTMLTERKAVRPYKHEFKRGQRKGETETRYEEYEADSLWEVVRTRYEAAGLTEDDALLQARLARILRVADYDFDRKEPVLWTPPDHER